jgi:peptide deformylase
VTKIITIPDKRLRIKSKPVKKLDKQVSELIEELRHTLKAQANPEGVGISAPQIGVNKRVFIIKTGFKVNQEDLSNLKEKVIVNPEVTSSSPDTNWDHLSSEDHYYEGCLSIPEVYGEVKRPWTIKVTYESPEGRQTEELTGFDAIYFQHEFDHLNGVLFTDKVLEQGGKLYRINPDGSFDEVINF